MRGEWIRLPDGQAVHVCYSGSRGPKCQFCRNAATLECDYPIGETLGKQPITCDKKMCSSCARPVGPDRDHCPDHSLHARRKTIRDPQTRKELDAAGYRWIAAGACRACNARIEWWETPNEKPDGSRAKMPMTVRTDDQLVNHWSVCPARRQFRQANEKHAERARRVKKPEQSKLF
jgi:hypothetical protein